MKRRHDLNDEIEYYQQEIDKNERDCVRSDDYVKQYTIAKNFFDQVKALKVTVEESSTDVLSNANIKSTTSLIKSSLAKTMKNSNVMSKQASKDSIGF